MPYRRLPNTDKARLFALQQAVARAEEAAFGEQAIDYRTLDEARRFLMQYENQLAQYHANCDSKVTANKKYRHEVHIARMYISHFIQVLNMAITRGEIKREQRALYQLPVNSSDVPDLSNEEKLLTWGKNIIAGEQERVKAGGFPIYNPTIAKVQVYYDIFREHYTTHALHNKTHFETYEDMEQMRKTADRLILAIWDQVETKFSNMLPWEKMNKCKSYGMIFYYRPSEKHFTKQTDDAIRHQQQIQTELQWS